MLLRAAAERHSKVAHEAARGRGFDRHLFVLRRMAEAAGGEVPRPLSNPLAAAALPARVSASLAVPQLPPIFSDPSYSQLSSNELSTSTLTAKHARQAIFGPVHPSGYGVYYSLPAGSLQFCATTYAPRSAAKLTSEIEAALLHVERVLEAESPTAAWQGQLRAKLGRWVAIARHMVGL